MNKQEIFQQLKDHYWLFQIDGWQLLRMGSNNGGMLAITFEADGSLTFPSKLGFLPRYRGWRFDEQHQEILLVNAQEETIVRLKPPVQDDEYRLVLNHVNSNDTYMTHFLLEPTMNDLWAPTPIMEESEFTSVNAIPTIITTKDSDQSQLITKGIQVIELPGSFESVNFWLAAYDELINRPTNSPVWLTADIGQRNQLQLLNLEPANLMIDINESNTVTNILGFRVIVMELLAELSFRLRQNQINGTNQTVQTVIISVLKQCFQGRVNLNKVGD